MVFEFKANNPISSIVCYPALIGSRTWVVVQFGSLAHVPIAIGINRGLSFKIFKLTHYSDLHSRVISVSSCSYTLLLFMFLL